jgi:hypothetical protein
MVWPIDNHERIAVILFFQDEEAIDTRTRLALAPRSCGPQGTIRGPSDQRVLGLHHERTTMGTVACLATESGAERKHQDL